MNHKLIGLGLFFLCAGVSQAASSHFNFSPEHWELSIAGGANGASANNTHLVVSPYETDAVTIASVSSSPLWKIGAGYHFFEDQLKHRTFLNDVYAELNLYHSSQVIKGSVLQYQLPTYNNYTFSAPVSSTRLILDVKPTLFTVKQFSLYPILGFGIAWNDIAYHETAASGISQSSANSLGRNTNNNFAYDIGGGIKVRFSQHIFGVVEYLYTSTSGMRPSSPVPSAPNLNEPPAFALFGHSILFGLNWKI